jgi:hypothetical protein
MNLTVIPGVLDTDLISNIPTEVIKMLPLISTDAIVNAVNRFVQSNSDSTDLGVRDAADQLRAAYSDINELEKTLHDSKAKSDLEILVDLDLSMLDARTTTTQELQTYRRLIDAYIGDEKDEKIQGFIPKKDTNNLESVLSDMECYIVDWPAVNTLVSNIRKYKSIFKDGQWTRDKQTMYSRIYKKRYALRDIKRGIDFLLDKHEKQVPSASWRVL